MRAFLIFTAIVIAGRPDDAQNVDANPKFEVVSIRPSARQVGRQGNTRITGGPGTRDPERFATENFSLYYLLSSAYDLKRYQIVTPQWTETVLFDISAKVPGGASRAQFRLMLQDMLAERFRLEAHWEEREIAAYDLIVKPSGVKWSRAHDDGNGSKRAMWDGLSPAGESQGTGSPGPSRTVVSGNYHLQLRSETMDQFSAQLTNELRLPVTNATGLNGIFDIGLTRARHETTSPQQDAVPDGAAVPIAPTPEGEAAPGIFTAIPEQLGLKLIPRKAVMRVLVVDRMNHVPTDN